MYCSEKRERNFMVMDNNNSQRPRKRITREIARKRQLTALFVIAFLVLLFVILIAKGCSSDKSKDSGKKKTDSGSNTSVVTTTSPADVPAVTTTTVNPETTTAPFVNTSGFKLDRYSVYLNVGESEMPIVKEYPAGSNESHERWSSSDTSVATVDGLGNITALAPGECYVILKSAADETQEVQIKVTVADSGNGTATTTAPAQGQQIY